MREKSLFYSSCPESSVDASLSATRFRDLTVLLLSELHFVLCRIGHNHISFFEMAFEHFETERIKHQALNRSF